MNYEKAYKAVLNTAKQWIKDGCSDKEKICLECVFPELRESEDERIRKELIEFIQWSVDRHFMREDFHQAKRPSEWIAYLEKQKDSNDMAFHEGYTLGFDDGVKSVEQKEPRYTKRNALFDKCVENCDPKVMKEVSDKVDEMLGKEQKPADEQFPPLEGLDKIKAKYYDDGFKNGFDAGVASVKPAEWSEKRKKELGDYLLNMMKLVNTGAEKLRYTNDELEKYVEKCVQDIIDLCPIYQQPKQEWSEEDDKMLRQVLRCLDPTLLRAKREEIELWLKSLRPSWKPSEGQMSMLLAVINEPNNAGSESCHLALTSLYNHLKKLI